MILNIFLFWRFRSGEFLKVWSEIFNLLKVCEFFKEEGICNWSRIFLSWLKKRINLFSRNRCDCVSCLLLSRKLFGIEWCFWPNLNSLFELASLKGNEYKKIRLKAFRRWKVDRLKCINRLSNLFELNCSFLSLWWDYLKERKV